jgi:hypothetical protein
VPPTGEPYVEGESDLTVLSIKSRSSMCFVAETSVEARKAGVEDVGRVSGGKYQPCAQFQPWPLMLKDKSHASHNIPERVGEHSWGDDFLNAACPFGIFTWPLASPGPLACATSSSLVGMRLRCILTKAHSMTRILAVIPANCQQDRAA